MPPTDPKKKPVSSEFSEMTLPSVDVGNEGAINLGDLNADDDEVQLASMPEPPSGQSLTSWTEVIRRQRATQMKSEASGSVKVDALSDRDLLTRMEEIPGTAAVRRPGDTSPIPPAQLPIFTPPPLPSGRSESDIDLGLSAARTGTGESEVKFDILYPPSDAGGVMPAPGKAPLSGFDFQIATRVPPPSESDIPFAAVVDSGASGVNLGATTGAPGEGGRSSILDVLLKDSANQASSSGELLDFGTVPVRSAKPTLPTAERPVVPTRPAIEIGDGAPEDDGLELIGTDRESEDAIDLYADAAIAPSISDSGTLEISEKAMADAQRRAELQESSSIDLNSRPSLAGEDFEAAIEAPSSHSVRSDSDVDLNLPPVQDEGGSSLVHGKAALDQNSAVLAAEFESRRRKQSESGSVKKARKRGEIRPARDDEAPVRSGGYLIHGGIIGLLLGAGGMLAAYFGGALPNRQPETSVAVAENSTDLARLKQDAEAARKEADQAKANLDQQVAEAKKASAGEIAQIKADAQTARNDAEKAMESAKVATAKLADADKTVNDAKKELSDAMKAAENAKAEAIAAKADVVAAKKIADDTMASVAKTFKDAGLDPAKPSESIKAIVDAKAVAEAKAKDADAKLIETSKKLEDLTGVANTAKKEAEAARKVAADAGKAREASDATVKAITDRLAKAKFVGGNADSAAILKGIDDAVKAGSSDVTATLRDELASARKNAVQADLEAKQAQQKLTNTIASLKETQSEVQKLVAENSKAKADAAKFAQELASISAKAAEAEKAAADAKTIVDRTTAEAGRLKVENDRLTRDLDAVKELADLIKAPATATNGPANKPDPTRLAEQSFGDGLRAFRSGQATEAESSFRKAVQFSPADARFHYFLGLTLWARKDTAGAQAEFEKGRDLELASRPPSKVIGAALERIQGPARQIVDSYRP
jgi:hypothetical protein